MSAQLLDFAVVDSPLQLRKQLREVGNSVNYSWIQPVVNRTTDEHVKQTLPARIARDRYAAWRVEDNIQEAGRILNNSLDRRSEIQSLEAEGLRMAMDLQFATQIQPHELELNKVDLRAAWRQAGLEPPHADESALVNRDTLITNSRMARLNLHATSGGALNYGERVTFLRDLLAHNIVMAYERLYAIWIGLSSSFGIDIESPPAWDGEDSLGKLVRWLRNATQRLDEEERLESVYDVLLLVGADGLADVSGLRTPGSTVLRFELKREHFMGLRAEDSIRLIGVGAALTFNEVHAKFIAAVPQTPVERERFSFGFEYLSKIRTAWSASLRLDFPRQSVALPELSVAERSWTLQPFRLNGIGFWSYRPASEAIQVTAERQFVNAVPLGEWEVEVLPDIRIPWGKVAKHLSGQAIPAEFRDLLIPKDIALALRVAVRRPA